MPEATSKHEGVGLVAAGCKRVFRRQSRAIVGCLVALSLLPACGENHETVVAVALHPREDNIVYVLTHEAVLKTRDGGERWERIFMGMTQSRVLAIGLDPAASSTVYIGTKDDGVYKSYDGGQHWMSRRTGLDDVRVTAEVQQVVFRPGARPRVLLASAMGVFESDDAGESWRKRMAGITNVLMVTTLAVDPQNSEVLYAGTSSGVYKSTDGARTWAAVNAGLIAEEGARSSRALGVTALALDARVTNTAYAGTLEGLYKTLNGGQTWSRIGQTLPDQFISTVVLDPFRPNRVSVGGRAGVFNSQDGGVSWKAQNAGLGSRNVLSLTVSQAVPGLLYAGTKGGGFTACVTASLSGSAFALTSTETSPIGGSGHVPDREEKPEDGPGNRRVSEK